MKNIYFIRHGESESNAGVAQGGGDSMLTERGIEQAGFMAHRCSKIPCDVVISSTLKRAEQTAEIINEKIDKPFETSDLFVERRRPSEQIGIPKTSPEWQGIEQALFENFHKAGYRYSDEENFEDLRTRAIQAFDFLEKRDEENIIVITHGFFMRIMMVHMLFGDALTGEIAVQCVNKCPTANTGLTIVKYDERSRKTPWFLWTWNDHAHLAE